MAKPQIENGYTRIANELFDALIRVSLRDSERRILLSIIRKTYGWQKKLDMISINQIVEYTNLSRRSVIYGLQNLELMKIITIERKKIDTKENEVNKISIQKDHDKWVVQGLDSKYTQMLKKQRDKYKNNGGARKKGSARIGSKVVQGNAKKGQILAPTKEKRNITKETIKNFTKDNPSALLVVRYFLHTMNDSEINIQPKTDKQKLEWLQCADWAIRRLGDNGREKVNDIIEYFRIVHDQNNPSDRFSWRKNFQSLLKLKKKNKEGVYYLDYFWSQLDGKVSYGAEQ